MNEADRRQGGEANVPPGGSSASRPMAEWVQEIVPYGIFTTDRELRLKNWNEWLVGHSGFSARDVIGRKLAEVYPDLEARRLLKRYARALEGEISVLSAALHKYLLPFPVTVAESGLPHMLQTARIAPLHESGIVTGTITIIEDVTQREFHAGILSRQQEFDRMLSEALATLLQSSVPVQEMEGIFATVRLALGLDTYVSYMLSPDRNALQLNGAVGMSPKQREAIAVLRLSEADQSVLRSGAFAAASSGSRHFDPLHKMGLRGQWCFPLTVGDRVLGLVAFGSYQNDSIPPSDINVLIRIARYVAIAIDRAARERDTVAASRAKDEFLAALSHELRTPLNPVLLVASDAAANPAFSDGAREAFRVIEKNALLEARLIDDLLDMTRIAHGKLAVEMQPFEIHASLRDAIQTVRAEMMERDLSFQEQLDDKGQIVLGDNGRLQQVFWNVLKNAVKFTPPAGKISITSQDDPSKNEIVIRVTDSGVGMDPHEMTRVFEAFAQGDHAGHRGSHRFGGLGLGLAIGRKLLEIHGGRIEAVSAGKGLGSTFTIHLPLAPKIAAADKPQAVLPQHLSDKAGSTAAGTPLLRILLVEDHGPTRISLARLLERRGYAVISVASVESALKEAAAGPFDLVLSDIGLPDDNGFSLMRQLHDRHGLKGIALTGYGMEEDLVRSRDAGFFAHLTKPISVDMLERALERAIEQPLRR